MGRDREDIVLKLEARVNSKGEGKGEGIGRGDAGEYGGSGDSGGYRVRELEGCKGGCDSGEKGFGSFEKRSASFSFSSFPSSLQSPLASLEPFFRKGKENFVLELYNLSKGETTVRKHPHYLQKNRRRHNCQ